MSILDKKIDESFTALTMARQDLCFAIQYMNGNEQYDSRLFGTILFITRILEDKEKFIEYMRRNNMRCPDCKFKVHRKCELHGN